ncbi:MAG: ATP-binding cassette domain-containing protein [Bacillati bacterium ANGP1]|uniref:ATP-binding cassette domain-containing protein n=1 Tax=Candidatus Segetimicrobium genomatis TaxID=2569760 RepID=A0A537J2E0_9BACT|nr:MAG: ATP-binding cassette domain-containing protein [Terrabacteria group bacterium ANGP1]
MWCSSCWCSSCPTGSWAPGRASTAGCRGRAEVPLLAVQGLRKSFGDTRAVDGVDFSIEAQRLISLVGSNGAGKTTLVNLITGLL